MVAVLVVGAGIAGLTTALSLHAVGWRDVRLIDAAAELRPVGANNYKLYVREGGKDRVLVDPEATKDASGTHSSLDFWAASPDGRHVAYGLSPAGSENSVVRVIEVASGRPSS